MKKILLAAIGSTLILFSACKPEPMIDISYEKALMDKRWILVGHKTNPDVNVPTNGWANTFGSIPPCVKDNKWYFKSTSDLTIDEGWTKCTGSAPQTIGLFYTIENEKYIKIYSNKANADGSIYLKGDFKLQSIDSFTIDERKQGATPQIKISTIYTFIKEK